MRWHRNSVPRPDVRDQYDWSRALSSHGFTGQLQPTRAASGDESLPAQR